MVGGIMMNKMPHRNLLLVIVSLVIVFSMLSSQEIAIAFQMPGTATPAPVAENIEALEIRNLEQMLDGDDLDEITRKALEEKLNMARTVINERTITAASWSARAESILPPAQQYNEKHFPEGVFEGGEGFISSSEAYIHNRWQKTIEDGFIQVFAGFSAKNPLQGVLYIAETSADRMDTKIQAVYPGEQDGGFRIVEADDGVLILESQNMLYCFDVLQRQFVCVVN